ncbi:MAG: two-component hybrid sensor and regulator [Bacteroidetes bacterium]|jgi:DNA-binding LytR/AlgR family response regulator|nr:two-component hybrid sensor and regulator [Bacteroidota bacterium]
MSALSFLIVEDELLIAELIWEILKGAGHTNIRHASTVDAAVKEIEKEKPDMVLTDINLESQKSGIDLANILNEKYKIPFIYITSHSSSDIIGKAKHTLPNAYIVKPFKKEDLTVAIELAMFNTDKNKPATGSAELMVKEGRAMIRLNCDHITWLETEGNYVTIYLENGKRKVVRVPLSELHQQLPSSQFVRTHKSYLVNKKHVTEIRASNLTVNGTELPIGRAFQSDVESFFRK